MDMVIFLALLIGFYVAWNIGANDVSNAMGTSVGSKALTLRQAVVIAGILEFCGAFFFGSSVSSTLQGGIISDELFTTKPQQMIIAMLAALMATGFWLNIASYRGWPVSTTHSIVGAIVGAGLIVGGPKEIIWGKVAAISSSWVLSPILGAIVAYSIFSVIKRQIFHSLNPVQAALKWIPLLTFFVFLVLSLIILIKGLSHYELPYTFGEKIFISFALSSVAGVVSYVMQRARKEVDLGVELKKGSPLLAVELEKARGHLLKAQRLAPNKMESELEHLSEEIEQLESSLTQNLTQQFIHSEYTQVESSFRFLQIVSACTMAFAHGANDVANAIGPLTVVLSLANFGPKGTQLTASLLALGGIGIVIGLATWGWRVMETVGKKITELTASRGFAAEFGASLTTLIASSIGFPISTTHTLVGAVLGVGMARGFGAVNISVIRDIAISWMVTIPAGAILCTIFYYLLSFIL